MKNKKYTVVDAGRGEYIIGFEDGSDVAVYSYDCIVDELKSAFGDDYNDEFIKLNKEHTKVCKELNKKEIKFYKNQALVYNTKKMLGLLKKRLKKSEKARNIAKEAYNEIAGKIKKELGI